MQKYFLLSLLSASVLCSALVSPVYSQDALQSGVVAIDIPESRAKSVTLDIEEGQFADYAVKRMTLKARDIDFRNGSLSGMNADVQNGNFENVRFGHLQISTGPFYFNTFELLNKQRFVLDQAVTANVKLDISEADLNYFISHPNTIAKIEQAIAKKMGGLRLFSFANPSIDLQSNNRIKLMVTGMLGQNGQGLTVPMEMYGQLVLEKGNLKIKGLKLSSENQEIPLPVNVADPFEDKLNEMINFKKLGSKYFVINGTGLNMTRDGLQVTGTAALTRLQFGK